MSYNPSILPKIMESRALTKKALSSRLKISPEALDEELTREPEPRQVFLRNAARALAVPSFIFYMKAAPALHDILPDFREKNPAPSATSRQTIEAIQLAHAIQRALTEKAPVPRNLALPTVAGMRLDNVEEYAEKCRAFFNISVVEQIECKDAKAFYVLCRRKIEAAGIIVLQDSFPAEDGSGFCLAHPSFPVIVINATKQTRARRLFTLVHELAHVLLRESGISDPFINENSLERLCNRFAGSFLVPKAAVNLLLGDVAPSSEPDLAEVRWASRRLKISQEASVVRLEQLGLFKNGTHGNWKRAIHNLGNPDFQEGGGGGAPPPQEKVKLAKYGFEFARQFDDLVRAGALSEIELYRISGLKPKYQHVYFDYVGRLTNDELQTSGLEDE